jgi:cytidine deaminase
MTQEEMETLVEHAERAMENALADCSGFRVGAALMTAEGEIFTGCNIENPSLMLSFCAERAALIKALTEGRRSFRAMAVVSSAGGYCYPCGACRQMLKEFAPGLALFLKSDGGIRRHSIDELLPHPFEGPKQPAS